MENKYRHTNITLKINGYKIEVVSLRRALLMKWILKLFIIIIKAYN